MLGESIQVIEVTSYEAFREIENRVECVESKGVILDVRQFPHSDSLKDDQKKQIIEQLSKVKSIVALVCMSEDSFFSFACKPYVDMMYLTASGERAIGHDVEAGVNGLIEEEGLLAVKDRLHTLTNGREKEHLQEIKALFAKIRNKENYTRQDLKMEESCLFCKLACEKEGLEDESRV